LASKIFREGFFYYSRFRVLGSKVQGSRFWVQGSKVQGSGVQS
jgi:hypothetical protein